jgi:hypothetical protein
MDREHILTEIRRLATEGAGQVPGVRMFERETGITEGVWRGVYWARWSDAVREAGLQPNTKQGAHGEQFLLTKLAEACRPSLLYMCLGKAGAPNGALRHGSPRSFRRLVQAGTSEHRAGA